MPAIIFSDLGFGDSGKGATIDHFARNLPVSMVIRYNGGAQAAHNVVTPEGIHHTFSQFGSATLANPNVKTFLGPEMLVSIHKLEREAQQLEALGVINPLKLITAHVDSLLLTPYHAAVNRIREIVRGPGAHGTCGLGIGVAREYQNKLQAGQESYSAPTIGMLRSKSVLLDNLRALQAYCADIALEHFTTDVPALTEQFKKLQISPADLADYYCGFSDKIAIVDWGDTKNLINSAASGYLLFEPGQGVLLDELHGFHPFNTWSDTTPEPAHRILQAAGFVGDVKVLGIIRALHTRHGHGPIPTEDADLTHNLQDSHNTTNPWQGKFRVGYFDAELFRYSLAIVKHLDGLCVTHMDYLQENHTPGRDVYVATGYSLNDVPVQLQVDFYQTFASPNMSNSKILAEVEVHYRKISKNDFLPMLELISGIPVTSVSAGPSASDRAFISSPVTRFLKLNNVQSLQSFD